MRGITKKQSEEAFRKHRAYMDELWRLVQEDFKANIKEEPKVISFTSNTTEVKDENLLKKRR